jgi:hypothetical protein
MFKRMNELWQLINHRQIWDYWMRDKG